MDGLQEWFDEYFATRVKVGVTDLDGVLRTKYMMPEKLFGQPAEFGFCNVIFGWDNQDALYDHPPDGGFADLTARVDPRTRRRIPWEEHLPFVLADFWGADGALAAACPRSLLRRVVDRATSMGFEARFGPELEWFVYRETPGSLAEKNYGGATPATPGMFGYSGLRTAQLAGYQRSLWRQLAGFQVNLEGLHTETGPGALEAAVAHRPALEAADRAQLAKQGIREISYAHGLLASFMAKPSAELPGCGGHLHQSLWREGKNAFYDAGGEYGMSDLFRHYLAGQLALLPELLPLFAPTVNSYKRYVPGSWAATHANWGVDNRTVALRVVGGQPSAMRLETRVPGADANPYLSVAAALAAGLYGIEQSLPLELPPVRGSAYEQSVGRALPRDLGEAAGAMQQSAVVRELLGGEFTDHFLRSRRWEWTQYQQCVTDWERRRYFELA